MNPFEMAFAIVVVVMIAKVLQSRYRYRQNLGETQDSGETVLHAGDVAAWPKGEKNGHHLQNRGTEDCVMIAVSAGDSASDYGEYPDIDLKFDERVPGNAYLHKDGTPYPAKP